jgi:Flp pilus assembly secretin CpaC
MVGEKTLTEKLFQYGATAGLALSAMSFSGCTLIKDYILPPAGIDFMDQPTIAGEAADTLNQRRPEFNMNVIHDGRLPIYSPEMQLQIISTSKEYDTVAYTARYIPPETLKTTLEEQLAESVQKISTIPNTNQLLFRISKQNQYPSLPTDAENGQGNDFNFHPYSQIKKLVEVTDVMPPQMMTEVYIIRIFADYTEDVSVSWKLNEIDETPGLLFNILSETPGAKVRVPERVAKEGLGIEYNIVGKIGDQLIIDASLDWLVSKGFAEDIARPTLLLANGKKGKVELMREAPYEDPVVIGGGLELVTKYKPVPNLLEVTPYAKDDEIISLSLKAEVSSLNPTGVLQVPTITSRKAELEEFYVRQGQTLVIAGFIDDHKLGVERKDPLLSRLPLVGPLFPHGEDREQRRDMLAFLVRPYYIDITQPMETPFTDGGALQRAWTEDTRKKIEEEKNWFRRMWDSIF